MAFEATKRLTRFPGDDEPIYTPTASLLSDSNSDRLENDSKRYTLFPGTDSDLPIPLHSTSQLVSTNKKPATNHIPPRLPLAINRPDAPSYRSLNTEINLQQNPYTKYKILRGIDRHNRVKVAYTLSSPTRIVTLKEVTRPLPFNEILECHHRNLLKLLEVYKFDGKTVIVSDVAHNSELMF
ncbi:hypothetical protein ACMFMF_006512 [Clarireedia jacksonii]